MRVKTPMGLERFEVRFFFGQKFTKIDLALEVVIKNRSKVVWGFSVMFLTIWLKNFFCAKSHMGTPFEWIFFTHQKKNQLQVRVYFAVQIKKKFGTIKDLPIWFFGNKGIFVSQTSYGHTMVWSSISSDFFDFERFDRKSIKIGYKPRKVLISKTASVRLKTFLYDSLKMRDFLWVETPIAIQRFEVHFRAIFSSSWQSIKNVLQIGYILGSNAKTYPRE